MSIARDPNNSGENMSNQTIEQQILEIQIEYNLNYFKKHMQQDLQDIFMEFEKNLKQCQQDELLKILNKETNPHSVLKMLKQLQQYYFGDLINSQLINLILEYKKTKNMELQISEEESFKLKVIGQSAQNQSNQRKNQGNEKFFNSQIQKSNEEFDDLIQREIYSDHHSSLFKQITLFINNHPNENLEELFKKNIESKHGLICKAGLLAIQFNKNQQSQQIKSQSQQIQESKQLIQQVETSIINTKKQQKNENENKNKSEIQQQQQQQQQKSFIFQQDGNKYQEIKSKINETASKIILEKSKSQIGSKITQKALKVKFCLKQVMDSLTMLGKLAYKTQAYYEVYDPQDQYRMKYINDLIQMINMNLILFDEIGLYDEDYKEIRNQIKQMLTAFLKSHQFHSQIIEQFKFLINYCTQPELKQIEAIQYDRTMPIIQESASLLEEQYLNFTKLKETYENGDMEAVDVEKQEDPFLVYEMVGFKDDFYTKSLDEAKRIKDLRSFDKFLLKLQSNQNQKAYIHFSTLLRLFNDMSNKEITNCADQLQQYCDKIKVEGHAETVKNILIEYTQLGHKYCFQYLYTAISCLQNEQEQNCSKNTSNQVMKQIDKI